MTTEVEAAVDAPTAKRARRNLPETFALAVVLIALMIFFSIKSEYFFTHDNLLNVLISASVIGIIAAPATLLLVAGQFDLSVGSGCAFIGVVMAWSADNYGSVTQAVFISILAGIAIGLVNGFCVTVLKINALITTLAMLAILRGLGQVIAEGQTLLLPGFDTLGNGRPAFDVPWPVFIFLLVMLATAMVMRYTVFGRSMYAIGSNPVAARLAGIRSMVAVFIGFVLSGIAVTVGGLILVSQLAAASPEAANGLELSVVTAVILGGASLAGGRGTVLGTLLGVLLLGVLNNGLTLLSVDSFWQDVARGALLLAAVGFDQLRLRLVSDN